MTNETPATGPTPATPDMILYDDFAKLQLRVGKVLEVADHPNADKLLVLKVDLGNEQRQIIAGLRGYVAHEQLLGRYIAIVANLAPRRCAAWKAKACSWPPANWMPKASCCT